MSKSTELTKDDVLDLLSNSRRRYVIYFLEQWDGSATLNDLAYAIASRETGIPEASLSEDDKRRVYISLYQTHLPKLDLYGLVDYDKEERTVTLAALAADLGDYFFPERRNARWWMLYYLALASLSLLASAAGALSVIDTTAVVSVGTAVALVIAVLAVYQWWTQERDSDAAVFEWLVDDHGGADE